MLSRLFTNDAINQADPVVMSNFGLMMIIVWGLVFLAASRLDDPAARWLMASFAVEKLVYVTVWLRWLSDHHLGSLYAQDFFAGVFYTIYGVNDLMFLLFFIWASVALGRSAHENIC